ncbi:MAG: hypothetical protein ACREP3_14450 [Candidatus Binatia bacterium]
MARKKQRKRGWLRTLVLFLLIPLAVWSIAFLIWFYWYDLSNLFSREGPGRASPKPPRQTEKDDRRERTPAPQPQEKIFEEDRKQLEDVLKRRN